MAISPHSGFAALIGRPNAGKSTLFNRLAGERLAITSHKPQTTRNRILGVINRPEGQLALLDTPGIHQAKGALNRYMVEAALGAAREVELDLLLIEPPSKPEVSEGNRFILERLKEIGRPTFLVINKIDLVAKPLLLPIIDAYRQAFPFAEILPISAKTGEGVDALFAEIFRVLPEGPPMFPEEMLTDQAERQLVAEYIREQVLRHTRAELPYSSGVVVDLFDESERAPRGKAPAKGLAGLIRIAATLYVERESQKAILIGKKGAMLKAIGTDARSAIERLLGTHLYLDLRVKVEPRWTEKTASMRKLGYE